MPRGRLVGPLGTTDTAEGFYLLGNIILQSWGRENVGATSVPIKQQKINSDVNSTACALVQLLMLCLAHELV